MNIMKMMQQAYKMQGEMKKIQKDLENKRIDIESNGIKICVNGKHEILSLSLLESFKDMEKAKLEKLLLTALDEVSKKVKKVLEDEAKKVTGGIQAVSQ